MSDWWYSNPSQGSWFSEYRAHWHDYGWNRPGGWMGTFRPHWQELRHRHPTNVPQRKRPCKPSAGDDALVFFWLGLLLLIFWLTPFGSMLCRSLPVWAGWLGR